MDERSLLFVGIIIVVVTGALVWSSNRATTRTIKRQQLRRSTLPSIGEATTNARSTKRRAAPSPQDLNTASLDNATVPGSQLHSHPLRPKSAPPTVSATLSVEEQQLYNALLTKVLGDRGIRERLIAFERERNPKGTRLDWIRDAHARWERDNR